MGTNRSAVVICTIARAQGTVDCLTSISASDKRPALAVVVDGSDSNEIRDALIKFSSVNSFPIVRISTKAGLPLQRNAGINAVLETDPDVKIIHFLDDDVTVTQTYFYEIEKVFTEFPDAIIVGGRDLNVSKFRHSLVGNIILTHSNFSGSITRAGNNVQNYSENGVKKTRWLSGYSQSFRTDVLLQHLFDEDIRFYGEEVDMQVRCSPLGAIYYCPEAKLFHHESQVGRSSLANVICWTDGARWHLCDKNRTQFSFYAFYYSLLSHLLVAGVLGILPRNRKYRQVALGHLRFISKKLRRMPLR